MITWSCMHYLTSWWILQVVCLIPNSGWHPWDTPQEEMEKDIWRENDRETIEGWVTLLGERERGDTYRSRSRRSLGPALGALTSTPFKGTRKEKWERETIKKAVEVLAPLPAASTPLRVCWLLLLLPVCCVVGTFSVKIVLATSNNLHSVKLGDMDKYMDKQSYCDELMDSDK